MPVKRYASPVNGQPLPKGKPFQAREEAREMGRKGGIASAKARAAKKSLRDELEKLLAEEFPDDTGDKESAQHRISVALVNQAIAGNVRAFEIIRDTIGQKPAETMNVNTPDPDIMKEIRQRMEQAQ